MEREDIKKMRIELGKFLHSYYTKFGEEKYDHFLKELAPSLTKEYGEPFEEENLRIMEAEYVMLNARDHGIKDTETTSKE